MDNWTGVILAGGLGSRLFPLTQDIPKPLVHVANKTMLDFAIDHLKHAGITKIIIVVKHMGEKIREHVEREWLSRPGVDGLDIQIPAVDSKDTADALRKVAHLINTEYVLVSMGDIVTNLPLKQFMEYHVHKGGFATISMKTIDEPTQYGVVLLDSDKKIYLFMEKPDARELYVSSFIQRSDIFLHTNLINTGIYAFKREILDLLGTESALMDFGKNVFPYLLENKYFIYGFVENYYWMDVGQPRPYLWANWDLLRKHGWPVLPPGEETEENAWYEGLPVTGEGCVIGKPVALGKNITLGANVHLKALTVLDDGATIGNDSVVERSVVWKNVKMGATCRVHESIICNDVVIGDGVSLYECVIGPGVVIPRDATWKHRKVSRDDI